MRIGCLPPALRVRQPSHFGARGAAPPLRWRLRHYADSPWAAGGPPAPPPGPAGGRHALPPRRRPGASGRGGGGAGSSAGLPHPAPSFAYQPTSPPIYLQTAMHKELAAVTTTGPSPAAAAAAGAAAGLLPDASRVFEVLWRHAKGFQLDAADLDAGLNALTRCQVDGRHEADLLRLLGHIDEALLEFRISLHYAGRRIAQNAWALARLAEKGRLPLAVLQRMAELFGRIEALVRQLLVDQRHYFEVSHISLLAWAFAKAGQGSPEFFLFLCDCALPQISSMSAPETAVTAWALATVRVEHRILGKMAEQICSTPSGPAAAPAATTATASVPTGSQHPFWQEPGHHVPILVWAFATLRVRHEETLRLAGAQALERVADLDLQSVINLTWGFAALRAKAPFLQPMLEHVRRLRRRADEAGAAPLGGKDCAMLLWAVARLRRSPTSELFFLDLADRSIIPHVSLFYSQDVSLSLWAYATSRVQHERVFHALTGHAVQIISSFNQQGLANALWSCAKMRVAAPDFVAAARAEAEGRGDGRDRAWQTQALVTVCWSLRELGKASWELLRVAAAELAVRGTRFNDLDLATLVQVCRSGEEWPEELGPLRRELLERIASQATARSLRATRQTLNSVTDQ